MFSSLDSFWLQSSRRKASAQRWTYAVTIATRLWRPSRLSPPPMLDPPWRTSPPPSPNSDLDSHTHTHMHTLLPTLSACSVFVCRGYRTRTREQLTLKRQIKFFRARCWLLSEEAVFCSVVDDSVHQKLSGCIHKWSSLKKELKTHYLGIMSCVVLALVRTFPLVCGENIMQSCILKPGSLLLPCLSAKAHTRQNVI